MTIPNSGNVTASSVVLKDTIPNGTTFIPNSIYVNGVNKPGDVVYPPTGVTIPDIGPNGLDTVSFQVIVTTIPNPNPTPNSANIGYIYVVNPSTGATNSGSINTNTVSTQINTAIISNPVKLVNKSYIDIGDTLTYTILLRNTGNVTANNVLFIDTIPNGTVLVPNSFKQDNTPIPSSPNPPGTTLPNSIAPSTTSTITFSVVAVSIPNPNPIPNSATNSFDYVVNPSVVPSINGYGNASTNVFFKDTIPNGTTMVKDSLFVNNIQIYGTNPGNGVTIPNIPGYSSSVIVFKVKVDC